MKDYIIQVTTDEKYKYTKQHIVNSENAESAVVWYLRNNFTLQDMWAITKIIVTEAKWEEFDIAAMTALATQGKKWPTLKT